MGEAKRRRDRGETPMVTYTDVMTGEVKTARNAGDPFEFLDAHTAVAHADQRGERPAASVPCQGCTACCHYKVVDFDPTLEPAGSLARLDYEPHENGWVKLRKRADGACIHLGETGCTVHADRPRPCRMYDCRMLAMVNSIETFGNDQKSPAWRFRPRTERGHIFMSVMEMLVATRLHTAPESRPEDLLAYALPMAPQMAAELAHIRTLSPAEQKAHLGFELPKPSAAEWQKTQREFYGAIQERRGKRI